MKNVGMAGAVALVGIGLIGLGSARLTNDLEDPCIILPPEDWFAPEGQPVCAGANIQVPNGYMGDLNGDGLSDRWEFAVVEQTVDRSHKTGEWSGGCCRGVVWIEQIDGQFQTVGQDVMNGLLGWHSEEADAAGNSGFLSITVKGLADVDGDGRRDLIVVRQTDPIEWPKGNGWFVHLNITDGEPLVADINRDGFVDGADMGLLIAAWTG